MEAVLRQLLGCSSAEIINHQNQTGDTALSLAAERGHANIVGIVLSSDTDISPNLPNKSGHTPLITAIYLKHYDVLRTLIGSDKVDVNYLYEEGTVLTWAAKWDAHQAVELLLTRTDLRVD
ncbi:ankyrin, partial [Morchella conica CCBAS932]